MSEPDRRDPGYSALDTPESIPKVFAEAWNRRDADKLASIFDEDAEFVNVVGLWWHDREAIRKAHAYGLATIFDRSTLRVGVVRVRQLGESIAVVYARMALSGQTPTGRVDRPQTRYNILSFVVRLGSGGWSCVSAQNTDIVPGMETNIVDGNGRLGAADYRPIAAPSDERE